MTAFYANQVKIALIDPVRITEHTQVYYIKMLT